MSNSSANPILRRLTGVEGESDISKHPHQLSSLADYLAWDVLEPEPHHLGLRCLCWQDIDAGSVNTNTK